MRTVSVTAYAINLRLRLHSIGLKYPSIFFLICFTWLGAKPSGFLVGWSVVSGAFGCKLPNVNSQQSICRSLTFQNTRNFISKIDINCNNKLNTCKVSVKFWHIGSGA